MSQIDLVERIRDEIVKTYRILETEIVENDKEKYRKRLMEHEELEEKVAKKLNELFEKLRKEGIEIVPEEPNCNTPVSGMGFETVYCVDYFMVKVDDRKYEIAVEWYRHWTTPPASINYKFSWGIRGSWINEVEEND